MSIEDSMVYCESVCRLYLELEGIVFNVWFRVESLRVWILGCGYGVL